MNIYTDTEKLLLDLRMNLKKQTAISTRFAFTWFKHSLKSNRHL